MKKKPPTRSVASAGLYALRICISADRRGTLILGASQVLSAVSLAVLVVSVKFVVEGLLDESSTSSTLWPVVALATAASLVSGLASIRAQQERRLAEATGQHVWRILIETVTHAPLIKFEERGFITTLSEVQRGGMSRPLPMTRSIFSLAGGILSTALLISAVASIAPILIPILALGALPAVVVSRVSSRLEFDFARSAAQGYMARDWLRDALTARKYAAEMRAYAASPRFSDLHTELDRDFTHRLRSIVRKRSWLAAGQIAGTTAALVAALVSVVILVDRGSISLASAGAAALAARMLSGQLSGLYSAYSGLAECVPFVNQLRDFTVQPDDRILPGRSAPLVRQIELRNISFSYPQSDHLAVDNVDLDIRAGEVVALVGENGSGKSTLATIASGLFEPTSGELIWDGQKISPDDLRARVATLFQDFGRFSLSVRDNIALAGWSDSDRDRITDAASRANFLQAAHSLADGFETMLGRDLDDGVDLSGGQWQRLALARALFKDAPLIVLDEPSAALDPRAESELFDDVSATLNGRAALIISHRFSNVRWADRIYVLHQGRVVERGTHTELMALDGRYAELFRLQSLNYLTE